MAQQRIIWTVLPHGRYEDGTFAGRLRVSIVASPRLTPEAPDQQTLHSFPEWVRWPDTLKNVKFRLRIGAAVVDLQPTSQPDPNLWSRFFSEATPVAGFVFKNMSQVNLRSFAVRNVLGLLRTHYGGLAVQSAGTHPTLLPWKNAHPNLKGMLTDAGTRTQIVNLGDRQIELPLPGFNRFFDQDNPEGLDRRLGDLVFGPKSRIRTTATGIGVDAQGNPVAGKAFPVRALPSDWSNPSGGGPAAPIMSQFSTAGEYTLYQANRFYRREPLTKARVDELNAQGQLRRPQLVNVPPPPPAPDYDFHQIVASFADYPGLLRALGLVIDCALPANSPIDQQISALPSAQGVMGLELVWSGGHHPADDSCPRTAWLGSKERFTTRPRSFDHDRGMLRLASAHDRWNQGKDSPFDVYQVDPDGAALKTVNFVLSAQNLVAKSLTPGAAGEVTYTTGDKQPVAALRSGGLGVSKHGRATAVAQDAASAALKDQAIRGGAAASQNIVLFTEDVLRGYRVDVQAMPGGVAGAWHSLCQRHGTYRFIASGDTIDVPDDEGYVKGASTTSGAGADSDPDDHYLHESLFRWTGWSLVAPRPGRTLQSQVDETTGVQGEVPTDVTDEATTGGNGLAVSFVAAKGSLPRLRFGVPYRFRARIVDLAGNSLDMKDPSLDKDPEVTQPVVYWRFEPVDPPALVHRSRTSEGESLERMVIRSNWNATAKAYLTTPAFAAARALPASADFEYTEVNERHAVPPKSSQLQCEQHGLFDPLFANPTTIKTAYGIAAREAGTLYDAGPSTALELVTPASVANVATTKALPPQLPSPDNPTGDRLAPGQYVIHREPQVATPYLPDGAAGGLALRAMPGSALPGVTAPMVLGPSAMVVLAPNQELVLLVAYSKHWPDTTGFRIVLAERPSTLTDPPCVEAYPGNGAPQWDESKRVLTLFVEKGRIVRLRYATFVDKNFVATLGLADWTGTAGDAQFVRAMANLGCGWMTNPYRSLVLVHATQQPVCAPVFLGLSVQRDLGDQHATLSSRLEMHGRSTGKFEIEAAWQEWVDDVDKPGPELVDSHGQLGEVQLPENYINLFSLGPTIDLQQPDGGGQKRARGDRHEFGDTKFRLIQYTLRATTRFREYLPPALYAQRDQVTRVGPIASGPAMKVGAANDPGAPVLAVGSGTALNTVVPATAPPDDPRVVYQVPTFRWAETAGAGSLDTTRLGNGLRVWLERPWFSSGNGELLGVVILGENSAFTDIPASLVPLVTQWGLDPLWDTVLPKFRSRVEDFTARVTSEAVSLREVPSTTVQVVGHRVQWDADRRLWYCDIELDPGATYMPFVRLAFVRYQPNALDGAKISKVVLGDFAQVLPRRRSTFKRTGAQVTLALHGTVPDHGPMLFPGDSPFQDGSPIPPLGTSGETGRNKIQLVLQTRDPALDSDLAWSDVQVLASSLLAPAGTTSGAVLPGGVITPTVKPGVAAKPAAGKPAAKDLTERLDLAAINIGTVTATGTPTTGITTTVGGGVITLIDPTIWQTTITLPAVSGKPARLVVREFERYYTDRWINQGQIGMLHMRRVVEERLVYTAFFNL
jgi:hypothetical protein